jgi:predicted nuclease with TOPRIM domain
MDSGLIWNVEIISISIILAFLGFLTTFIVISNYAQVKEVKDEFTKQITDTKDEFGKEVSEIESLRKEIEDLRKKISSKFDQYNGNFLQMFMRNDDFQENFNTNYDKFKNLHEILKEISDRLDKVEQIDKQ